MIAELPDGTELEFPDDTPDDVVDRVVKQHLRQSKPQATWGETLQGGVSQLAKNMGLGGLSIAGGVDEIGKAMYEPVRLTLSALGTEVQVPDSGIGETMAETKKFYDEADPTLTKQMTTGQQVTKAGTQLLSLAGGPVGLGTMLAGGTTDEAMRMLDEGMPLDKTQAYMAMGKPVLMAVTGDAAELVQKAECGGIAISEDEASLEHAILKIYYLPIRERLQMGINAQTFYIKELSLESGVKQFVSIFEKVKHD